MNQVLIVGSVNRDVVLKVARRPAPGETVTDAEMSLHGGGKGANQAVAAARLGARVAMIGRVGDDSLGESLLASMKDRGVEVSRVKRTNEAATGVAVITVTPDGENAITVAPGANRRLTTDDVEAASEAFRNAEVVVAQMEIPPEVVERASEIARNAGARMLLNFAPARSEAPPSLLEGLDPLVVNEHEAAFLLGKKVSDVDTALSAAGELLALGPRSVVVTLGPDGAVCASEDSLKRFRSPRVDVKDTTGAGDAFVGALAARLAAGDGLPEAVSYAVLAGAVAVTGVGAQEALPTPEDVAGMQPASSDTPG